MLPQYVGPQEWEKKALELKEARQAVLAAKQAAGEEKAAARKRRQEGAAKPDREVTARAAEARLQRQQLERVQQQQQSPQQLLQQLPSSVSPSPAAMAPYPHTLPPLGAGGGKVPSLFAGIGVSGSRGRGCTLQLRCSLIC